MSQIRPSTKPRYFKRSKNKVVPEETKKKPTMPKLSKHVHLPKNSEEHKKHVRPQLQKPTHSVKDRKLFGNSKVILNKIKLQWVAIGVLAVLGILWNVVVGSMLFSSAHTWIQTLENRQKLSQQMNLWENIAKEYPYYRDAYVEGALLAYRLGDRQKEEYFLRQLQLLDPNFPLTKTLEQLTNLQSLNR